LKQELERICDAASINNFEVVSKDSLTLLLVKGNYYLPRSLISEIENKGYDVKTLRCENNELEITIGGIKN